MTLQTIIRKLNNGAHMRANNGGWELRTTKGHSEVSRADFDRLFDRGAITHTFGHNIYRDGCVWVRTGRVCTQGGASA